jgi:hypothetical protein
MAEDCSRPKDVGFMQVHKITSNLLFVNTLKPKLTIQPKSLLRAKCLLVAVEYPAWILLQCQMIVLVQL